MQQFGDELLVAPDVLPVIVLIAMVVVLEFAQEHQSARLLVAKKRDALVRPPFQIAEADDVAEGLFGVEDAIGSGEGLQQTVHLQVLVHPEGV